MHNLITKEKMLKETLSGSVTVWGLANGCKDFYISTAERREVKQKRKNVEKLSCERRNKDRSDKINEREFVLRDFEAFSGKIEAKKENDYVFDKESLFDEHSKQEIARELLALEN